MVKGRGKRKVAKLNKVYPPGKQNNRMTEINVGRALNQHKTSNTSNKEQNSQIGSTKYDFLNSMAARSHLSYL